MITRESLLDGSFAAKARELVRRSGNTMYVRSEAEQEATLNAFLAERPDAGELWIFGYGSLMWNPALEFAARRHAKVTGWRRSFCILDRAGRGSPATPALMLALEQGGATDGIAFRLPPASQVLELTLCWRREMFSNSYTPLWAPIDLEGRTVQGVVFTVNPGQDRYRAEVSALDTARMIASASGPHGSNLEYFDETLSQIAELGLTDPYMEEISRLISSMRSSRSEL